MDVAEMKMLHWACGQEKRESDRSSQEDTGTETSLVWPGAEERGGPCD